MIRAVYTDQGDDYDPPLSVSALQFLRSPLFTPSAADETKNVDLASHGGVMRDITAIWLFGMLMSPMSRESRFGLQRLVCSDSKGGTVKLRLDDPEEPVWASAKVKKMVYNKAASRCPSLILTSSLSKENRICSWSFGMKRQRSLRWC
ncbi:MAG: hypothetical protein M2R45_04339 [Verrucomicrobia subdivision 3 bacterium]|nr:hypothetical protein [Limisphaerales bacterium]MCS1416043.1 hypothetical protein [Limisphaerales bacterium]